MGGRHVSGTLKQTNKKHKGERKRCDSSNLLNRTRRSEKSLSKKSRKLQAKQHRQMKNKMVATGQKSVDKPLMCLLLPLHEDIDLNLTQKLLSTGDSGSSIRMHEIRGVSALH